MKIGKRNGGKGLVYQKIVNQQPPHDIYIAPFVGGGSVTINKRPALLNILIDTDDDVVEAWKTFIVKNGGHRVTSKVAMGAAIDESDDVCRCLSLDVAMVATKSHSAEIANSNDTAPTSKMFRPKPSNLTMSAVPSIVAMADQLHRLDDIAIYTDASVNTWAIIHADARDILPLLPLTPSTLIYADPPYIQHTRASSKPLYKDELNTLTAHSDLLDLLLSTPPCMIQLSGYQSGLYTVKLRNWREIHYTTYTRMHREVEEYLWMNYPEPNRLHTYTHLGHNFRERERIKRKAKRQVTKFKSLPRLERLAIIAALEEAQLLD